MKLLKKIQSLVSTLNSIKGQVANLQEAVGRIELRQLEVANNDSTQKNEFKVYSQWGEDGIIQYLLRHIDVKRKIFIEFGVENYTESNTRFLLVNNNWSGLIIDGSPDQIQYIKKDPVYWRHNLKAECEFINKNNINDIFKRNGITGEIGILSIDIDGNDYWVWEAIDCVDPAIVITEYNARFGPEETVSIPYDENFVRSKAHHSMIYYGASLNALTLLADKKGYALVGCNTSGNNAFFIKKELLAGPVNALSAPEAYVAHQFRESRGPDGELIFWDRETEKEILMKLPLTDVSSLISS